jgi:hypothetical protein
MSKAKGGKPEAVVVEEEKKPELPQTGFGKFEYINDSVYVGNWKMFGELKKKHGHGRITHGQGTIETGQEYYEGDWEDDLMHGYGIYHFTSGALYMGNWA